MTVAFRLHGRSGITLVLAAWLLIAQIVLLAHAAEHDIATVSDGPHAACLLCHAADGSGQGLRYSLPFQLAFNAFCTQPSEPIAAPIATQAFFRCYARGPP